LNELLQFAIRHGYTMLFLLVLIEQIGLPVPAIPLLLAAGALAGADQMSFAGALLVAVTAALIPDLSWFELGRRRGGRVLAFLCRISLEPDSCVRRTEDVFQRHGARSLLIAKFIPGLNTAAPPLAGMVGMSRGRFLAFDTAGAIGWAGSFMLLGWIFSEQLEVVAAYVAQFGNVLLAAIVFGIPAAYVAFKYREKRKFLRELEIARIHPHEVHAMMAAGESLTIIDLRHPLDLLANAATLPGALHIAPEHLETRHAEIPRDRDIILYCT
jgi:membrane protein DedA with SNARE-associated domain